MYDGSSLTTTFSGTAEVVGGDLTWSADLRRALDDARARNGRVFVDFTGVTCTNCKLNEREVFTKPDVRDLFRQYTLVQMYTDDVPVEFYANPPERLDRKLEAAANLEFQKAVFGTEQLPLYAVLAPQADGSVKVAAVYEEGKINDAAAFVEFLRKPLTKN